jgi:UDP-2-acetamido-3-amino-2,3-dideoxy-glucuronate N-acetyltransferase
MKKNIAVVGCGYWGKNLVRNFNELDSLLAICDSDRKILDSFKEKYPDLITYSDYKDVLKDPGIQAVVIAAPAAAHYEMGKEALLADKDIFVEKPISITMQEGEGLVSLAEERKRILMVGHILEYHPAVIRLKEVIDQGYLGKIYYIYSNRLNLGKFRTEENILWSFAPHDISVILSILKEMPEEISAFGGNYLNSHITDTTVTNLTFPGGTKAHIFVSWLHPYKEQKLIIIGENKMIVFDDVNPENKLLSYDHKIDWIDELPVPRPEEAQPLEYDKKEPLKAECEHFLDCIRSRKSPKTDGNSGLKVLQVLEACQRSLKEHGMVNRLKKRVEMNYFVHETSVIDDNVTIGKNTKIWHFSHVLKNSQIGKDCNLGQNVVIGPNVKIGNNVKIQNNVSVYDGVTLEDDVFCGPSMVFTNVTNPRSHWPRKDEYKKTLVKRGASLGANSTIVCGITIGQYAFVGAGALVNKDVPDYALVFGIPAQIQGWMCYCGFKLDLPRSEDSTGKAECIHCGRHYEKEGKEVQEIKPVLS